MVIKMKSNIFPKRSSSSLLRFSYDKQLFFSVKGVAYTYMRRWYVQAEEKVFNADLLLWVICFRMRFRPSKKRSAKVQYAAALKRGTWVRSVKVGGEKCSTINRNSNHENTVQRYDIIVTWWERFYVLDYLFMRRVLSRTISHRYCISPTLSRWTLRIFEHVFRIDMRAILARRTITNPIAY